MLELRILSLPPPTDLTLVICFMRALRVFVRKVHQLGGLLVEVFPILVQC